MAFTLSVLIFKEVPRRMGHPFFFDHPACGIFIVCDFRSDDLVWLCVYESPLQGERSLRGVL